MSEMVNHHRHAAVHQNAVIFELVQASDHILLSLEFHVE